MAVLMLKYFNGFLFMFYFLGLAPFYVVLVDIKINDKIFLIPVILSSILNIVMTGYLLSTDFLESFGQIQSVITVASILSGLIINLSGNFLCWFHKFVYQDIIYRIKEIESRCNEIFSENLPSSSFANRYRLKVLLISSFFATNCIFSVVELWYLFNMQGVLIVICSNSIIFFSAVVVVHAILYIDIVQMFLRGLNLHIQNSPLCFYSSSKIEFLKNIKLLHMDLWKLVMQINQFFSWSLLFITINFMIDLVYDLYFIFRTLQFDWDGLDVTGNTTYFRNV